MSNQQICCGYQYHGYIYFPCQPLDKYFLIYNGHNPGFMLHYIMVANLPYFLILIMDLKVHVLTLVFTVIMILFIILKQ